MTPLKQSIILLNHFLFEYSGAHTFITTLNAQTFVSYNICFLQHLIDLRLHILSCSTH